MEKFQGEQNIDVHSAVLFSARLAAAMCSYTIPFMSYCCSLLAVFSIDYH